MPGGIAFDDSVIDALKQRLLHGLLDIGTWTPAFGGTTTPGTFTYNTGLTAGQYVRIGPMVSIWGCVAITAIPTPPTGVMAIANLPFAAVNTANVYGGVYFTDISNFNYATSAIDLQGLILPGESFIRLLESFDNAASASTPAANFTNVNCSLVFAGSYRVE